MDKDKEQFIKSRVGSEPVRGILWKYENITYSPTLADVQAIARVHNVPPEAVIEADRDGDLTFAWTEPEPETLYKARYNTWKKNVKLVSEQWDATEESRKTKEEEKERALLAKLKAKYGE